MAVIIPIKAGVPSQYFSITLDSVAYYVSARWNSRASFWIVDFLDENETTIISGLALKKGDDLLEPYNFDLSGPLQVQGVEATLSNIGEDSFLTYGD